jgi:hypothetical protein
MELLEKLLVEHNLPCANDIDAMATKKTRTKAGILSISLIPEMEATQNLDDIVYDANINDWKHKDGYLHLGVETYFFAPRLWEICKQLSNELEELKRG